MARLTGVIAWLGLALLGFGLAPELRRWLTPASTLTVRGLGHSACTPGVACAVRDTGAQVTLHLPAQMRTLTPYTIQIQVSGLMPQRVQARFEMAGMEMHLPPTVFSPEVDGATWQARVILPVCSLSRSDWQAWVNVETAQQQVQARFDFRLGAI